ncbi:MAG: hypothetical protein LC799_02785, partial [Actinobacteria bacterium]|nr:hypothetical protein [Actinomycetota bacterium]
MLDLVALAFNVEEGQRGRSGGPGFEPHAALWMRELRLFAYELGVIRAALGEHDHACRWFRR